MSGSLQLANNYSYTMWASNKAQEIAGDGKITATELRNLAASIGNKDGKLSVAELEQAGFSKQDANKIFAQLQKAGFATLNVSFAESRLSAYASSAASTGKAVVNTAVSTGKVVANAAVTTGKTVVNTVVSTGKAVVNTAVATGKVAVNAAVTTGKVVVNTAVATGKVVAHAATTAGKVVANTAVDVGKKVVNTAVTAGKVAADATVTAGKVVAKTAVATAKFTESVVEGVVGVDISRNGVKLTGGGLVGTAASIGKTALDVGGWIVENPGKTALIVGGAVAAGALIVATGGTAALAMAGTVAAKGTLYGGMALGTVMTAKGAVDAGKELAKGNVEGAGHKLGGAVFDGALTFAGGGIANVAKAKTLTNAKAATQLATTARIIDRTSDLSTVATINAQLSEAK